MKSPREALDLRIARLSPAKRALFALERDDHVRTGHQHVARALRAQGVSTVYGVAGVPVYATFGACAREGLRPIGARHQQAATLMAVAHNYVAGRPVATALVSSGAAASNALTGVVVARDNAWPLVLLAGAVPREPRDFGHFTELDVETLFRPVAKASLTLERAADIPGAIHDAFALAVRGRPGPVVLQLPADILNASTPAPRTATALANDPVAIDAGTLDDAARRLATASRPLLVLGKGARWNDAFADVQRLVEVLDLPFVTSPIARGYIPDDHPRCCNAIGWIAQREADLVLLLGARLDWTFRHGTHIAPDAAVIQVDVQHAELGRNRPADLPVHGDIRMFVRGVLARLPGSGALSGSRNTHWIESLHRRRLETVRAHERECAEAGSPITPAQFAHTLGRALPPNAITVLDGNLSMRECQRHVSVHDPVCRLTPGSNGCLGVGVPYAIGAKLACPARPVVAVCGDFAFGLAAFEMETAVRHGIPIVVIVANNDGNAGATWEREMFPDGHPERVSMSAPGLRYGELMRVFGGHAEHVDTIEALAPALSRALAASGPACINVALDPNAPFPRD